MKTDAICRSARACVAIVASLSVTNRGADQIAPSNAAARAPHTNAHPRAKEFPGDVPSGHTRQSDDGHGPAWGYRWSPARTIASPLSGVLQTTRKPTLKTRCQAG